LGPDFHWAWHCPPDALTTDESAAADGARARATAAAAHPATALRKPSILLVARM
jgi:hypothetical protein